ncbi:S41 family peptidase [Parasphingorhabdus cellanae]|uniref:Tail specific protease domain-containing protein n=1 Tax=Parasphingorhabdus cellanae TaxID=2806553 RepID=A0ABX7T8V1_9SPHN|nr:S41 family peptidase [Parasphingorhabdus cellanae]QTD57335.1 hypothetical protein J4G78_07330 [Parasphingorhabdus cellanae]
MAGLVCFLALVSSSAFAANWPANTLDDLTDIKEAISENHPGPVDPENPKFVDWLNDGYEAAEKLAKKAKTKADYERVLRQYVNGFRDGHLLLYPAKPENLIWPGFLTRSDGEGKTTVSFTSPLSSFLEGSKLVGCDGTKTSDLLEQRVFNVRTNKDIPHEKIVDSPHLFLVAQNDQTKPKTCSFLVNGKLTDLYLDWSAIDPETAESNVRKASGNHRPELGIQKIDGVWFISLPTFNFWGERAVKIQNLITELGDKKEALHKAEFVVFDVRGNDGGNSGWGDQIVAKLWGARTARNLETSKDQTVDWRVSEYNEQALREQAIRSADAGLTDASKFRIRVADDMRKSRINGTDLMLDEARPTGPGLPLQTPSPFQGKVYLLTDWYCASACLDFADNMRNLADVVHIGQPTSADSVYIDNVWKDLPSGEMKFSWSLKVYRNRLCANNIWYDPVIRWTGGEMEDEAVAQWVKTLAN